MTGARGEVGPGDLIALRRQHLGDAAHAGAADADEVDALDLVLHRRAPQRDAGVGDAIGGVECARALRAARSPSRAARRARTSAQARREPLRRELGLRRSSSAAPASTRNCAFALCSSAIAPGSGTMIAATPTAASSATVIAPPRQRTTSASA